MSQNIPIGGSQEHLLRVKDQAATMRVSRLPQGSPVEVALARLSLSSHATGLIVGGVREHSVADAVRLAAALDGPEFRQSRSNAWRKLCDGERESDLLAKSQIMAHFSNRGTSNADLISAGLHVSNFRAVRALENTILSSLREAGIPIDSTQDRSVQIKLLCTAMRDSLFAYVEGNKVVDADIHVRFVDRDSVVALRSSVKFLVGSPFDHRYYKDPRAQHGYDLRIQERLFGTEPESKGEGPRSPTMPVRHEPNATLPLLRNVTVVPLDLLKELDAPNLRIEREQDLRYRPDLDRVESRTRYHLGSALRHEIEVVHEKHPVASAMFAKWVTPMLFDPSKLPEKLRAFAEAAAANAAGLGELQQLARRTGNHSLFALALEDREGFVRLAIGNASSVEELQSKDPKAFFFPVVSEELRAEATRLCPTRQKILGFSLETSYGEGEYLIPTATAHVSRADIEAGFLSRLPEKTIERALSISSAIKSESGHFIAFSLELAPDLTLAPIFNPSEFRTAALLLHRELQLREAKFEQPSVQRTLKPGDTVPNFDFRNFGKHAITGKPHTARGTYCRNDEGKIEYRWFASKSGAEKARSELQESLRR